MKGQFFLIAVVMSVSQVNAQQSASTPAAGPATAAQPCDPVEPDRSPNGDPIYTSCQIKALGGEPPKLVSTPAKPDVSELHSKGVQGEIIFHYEIEKDGRPYNVTVKTSSRSADLDAIGVEFIKNSTFSPAKDPQGNPVLSKLASKVEFWKDGLWKDEAKKEQFLRKTCDQFLIDAAWHHANFPEEKPEDYRGWMIAKGIIFLGLLEKEKLVNIKYLPTYPEVVESCKNNPQKTFFEALVGKP